MTASICASVARSFITTTMTSTLRSLDSLETVSVAALAAARSARRASSMIRSKIRTTASAVSGPASSVADCRTLASTCASRSG